MADYQMAYNRAHEKLNPKWEELIVLHAQQMALGHALTNWNRDWTYAKVMRNIWANDFSNIEVWEQFEDMDYEDLAEQIESEVEGYIIELRAFAQALLAI